MRFFYLLFILASAALLACGSDKPTETETEPPLWVPPKQAARAELDRLGIAYTDDRAFHGAVEEGNLALVKLFVEAADRGSNFAPWLNHAFHIAAEEGHLAVVQYLVEQGADLTARRPPSDWTALHYAAWNGHLDVVKYLVTAGAYLRALGKVASSLIVFSEEELEFWTAKDMARYRGHTAIVTYLNSVGG